VIRPVALIGKRPHRTCKLKPLRFNVEEGKQHPQRGRRAGPKKGGSEEEGSPWKVQKRPISNFLERGTEADASWGLQNSRKLDGHLPS